MPALENKNIFMFSNYSRLKQLALKHAAWIAKKYFEHNFSNDPTTKSKK